MKTGESHVIYSTDSERRFVASCEGIDTIVLEKVSEEFDGICDDDGVQHFLVQDVYGALLYLKLDGNTWIKYNIFKNRENKQRITSVHLSYSEGILCAFYAIEHKGSVMLVKHIFSSANLYSVPEVIGLLDIRKDFCICTNSSGNTEVFYRNENGERIYTLFDKSFKQLNENSYTFENDIYTMNAVCNGTKTFLVYTAARKNYMSLIFKPLDSNTEKIITFAIARNCKCSVMASNNTIVIQWTENDAIMQSISNDGGQIFSQPRLLARNKKFQKIRFRGAKPGSYYSDSVLEDRGIRESKKFFVPQTDQNDYRNERVNGLNSAHESYRRKEYDTFHNSQIIRMLDAIRDDVEKIGTNLEKACLFLDKLTDFKNNIDNNIFLPKEDRDELKLKNSEKLGVVDEKNLKLFESMNVDDVLPTNSETEKVAEDTKNEN